MGDMSNRGRCLAWTYLVTIIFLSSLGRSHLEEWGRQKLCGLFTRCSGVSWEDGECTNYEGIAR